MMPKALILTEILLTNVPILIPSVRSWACIILSFTNLGHVASAWRGFKGAWHVFSAVYLQIGLRSPVGILRSQGSKFHVEWKNCKHQNNTSHQQSLRRGASGTDLIKLERGVSQSENGCKSTYVDPEESNTNSNNSRKGSEENVEDDQRQDNVVKREILSKSVRKNVVSFF